MSDTEVTFARARLGGHPEEMVVGDVINGQVVYLGGALAIHIPEHLDPAVIAAASKAFAEAALKQSTRHTIRAVA